MASIGPLAFGGSDFSGNFTTDNGSFTEAAGVLQSSTSSDFNRARVTSTAMDSANHYVQAVIGGRDSTNCGEITARQASSTHTCYTGAYIEYSSGIGYRIRRITAGSETDLDTASASAGAQTFRLDVDGATQTLTVASVEVCTAADSTITSGNYVGVMVWTNNGGQWDDFEAADLAGASLGDLIQSTQNSGGTATLTLSGAPTSGNLLIYGTVSGNSGVTLSTPPSGFTEITSHTSADYSSWWGYKISDGTETARNHAWSAGNGYSLYAEYYWQEGTPRVNSNEDTSNVTADGTGPQSSGSVTPHDLTTNLCLAFITSRYQPSSDGSGAFSNSYNADVSFAATPTLAGTAIASLANASGSTSSSYSWSDAGIDTYGAIAAFSPPGAGGGLLPLLNAYYS